MTLRNLRASLHARKKLPHRRLVSPSCGLGKGNLKWGAFVLLSRHDSGALSLSLRLPFESHLL